MSDPTKIDAIEAELRITSIELLAAEGWAPGYAEQPKYFARLLLIETAMDRLFRDYLRQLSQRVNSYIAWTKYHEDIATVSASEDPVATLEAYDVNVLFDSEDFANDEETELESLIREIYIDGIALGYAAQWASRTGTTPTIVRTVDSPAWLEIQEAAHEHIKQLAQYLDKTTAKNIVDQLQKSIALGESQELAMQRLIRYIDDPARADMIARTESVRAWSIGAQRFAVRNNASQKYWQALPGADSGSSQQPCLDNDGQTVDILDAFPSGDEMTPAHPNCRCRVDYIYPDGSVVEDV